jgi:23S rRNA (uracil1939-C5)-methyltransferase
LTLNQEFQLSIQSLVYEGTGLGRLPDGKAVFVPFVLPDELVQIRIAEDKQRFAFADLISIEKESPLRIQPQCEHFGECGGCHYQHIAYKDQIKFKKEILLEQFQRIGKTEPQQPISAIPSPMEWAYRNAVQFHINQDGKLCFNNRRNELFVVKECHLPMPAINQIWPQIDFGSGLSIDRIEFRQSQDGEIMIGIRGERNEVPEIETDIPASIVHLEKNDSLVLAGDDRLDMWIGERHFRVHAASFFQTNFRAAEKMAVKVREIIVTNKCKTIFDVFCGVGFFSAFLADTAEKIVGVESSPTACDDYAFNLDAYDNATLYQGRAEQILPALDSHPDCVILDPPRAGLRKEVTQAVIQLKPRLLIYISCNPATLARDSRHLKNGGYQLKESVLVDMFPQTYHIESINTFVLG